MKYYFLSLISLIFPNTFQTSLGQCTLKIYDGKIFCLNEHILRLQESAKSLNFKDIPNTSLIKKAIFKTLRVNNMRDETHIRLTLTRGKKITSGMNPILNQYGSTLLVLAEWTAPIFSNLEIRLITSSIRRNSPSFLDYNQYYYQSKLMS